MYAVRRRRRGGVADQSAARRVGARRGEFEGRSLTNALGVRRGSQSDARGRQ